VSPKEISVQISPLDARATGLVARVFQGLPRQARSLDYFYTLRHPDAISLARAASDFAGALVELAGSLSQPAR